MNFHSQDFLGGDRLFPFKPKYDPWRRRFHLYWTSISNEESMILFYIGSLLGYLEEQEIFSDIIFYEELCEEPR